MTRASVSLVTAAGMAILLLSGCSGPAEIKALERAATPEDALPAFVTVQESANRDTSRLLVTKDGVRYFVIQSDDARTTCLARVPAGEAPNWLVGCGDTKNPGEIVNISSNISPEGPVSTILLGDDSDTGKIESGWTKISDNILISNH